MNEDHVHAGLEQLGIKRQRFAESCFGQFVIPYFSQAFQHPIDVTTTERRSTPAQNSDQD